jgi:hypothetical protein
MRSLGPAVLFVLIVATIAGCAGAPGTVRPREPVAESTDLRFYERLIIHVKPAVTAGLMPHEATRMELLLESKLVANDPSRFTEILLPAVGEIDLEGIESQSLSALYAEVLITSYDRGNSAQRALGFGMGQIEVAGSVSLMEWPSRRLLGSYDIEKTFVLGGIYGASTSIEDVEHGFAESAADVILQSREIASAS